MCLSLRMSRAMGGSARVWCSHDGLGAEGREQSGCQQRKSETGTTPQGGNKGGGCRLLCGSGIAYRRFQVVPLIAALSIEAVRAPLSGGTNNNGNAT